MNNSSVKRCDVKDRALMRWSYNSFKQKGTKGECWWRNSDNHISNGKGPLSPAKSRAVSMGKYIGVGGKFEGIETPEECWALNFENRTDSYKEWNERNHHLSELPTGTGNFVCFQGGVSGETTILIHERTWNGFLTVSLEASWEGDIS